jgi:prepilin peptidase
LLALIFTFLQLGVVSALTYFKLAAWARAYIKAVGDVPREAWSAKDLLLVAALTNRGMAVSVLLGGALLVGALSLPQALGAPVAATSLSLPVPVLAALIPAALVDWRVQHLPTRLLLVAGAVLLFGMGLAWLGPQVAPAGIDDVVTPLRTGDLLRALGGGVLVYIALAALSLLPQLWGRAPGIGMGDANLYVVLGTLLALHGWSTLLMGLYLGFFFGGLVALGLLLSGRLKLKGRIAFGPWLMVGATAALALTVS